jgi:hypothetical protein
MRYKIECDFCKRRFWCDGEEDLDTNSCEVDTCTAEDLCVHLAEGGTFTVTDSEYPARLDDDVI